MKQWLKEFFTITQNKLLAFALLCVAVTSAFIMYMRVSQTEILSKPDWCVQAINAERLAQARSVTAIDTCKELLLKQIGSIAMNSHIDAGIIGLCLLVLMVIVVAGANLSFSVSPKGASANMSKNRVAEAAQEVADAAEDKAVEISDGELAESERIK